MSRIFAKGGVLIYERLDRGMTLREFGKQVGVTGTVISKLEQRKGGVRPRTANKICEFLDRTFSELFEVV